MNIEVGVTDIGPRFSAEEWPQESDGTLIAASKAVHRHGSLNVALLDHPENCCSSSAIWNSVADSIALK